MSLVSYTAACVRACALRSALLGPAEWDALGRLTDARAVIDRLKARGVLEGGVTDVLAAERAGHEAVIRNATGLLRFSRGALADLLRCFVQYYDLLNIENVMHRIHAFPDEQNRPQGRSYDTGPFGLLRPATLDAVSNYPALHRVLRGSVLAAPYEAALRRYREDEDVTGFVENVEFAFFADWLSAADGCGIRPRDDAANSAMALFFVTRAIEAAVRLKLHRQAQTGRVAQWLALVAPASRVDACLALCAGDERSGLVQGLMDVLLPGTARTRPAPEAAGPRGQWGLLDRALMQAAARSTRGIAFDVHFLTGFLLRQWCQARELTVLLESKDAGLDSGLSAQGGTNP